MPLHQPSGRVALGLSLALVTTVLWGVLPLVLKMVLVSLDAVTITWFRFGVSAAVLALWLGARGGLPRLDRLPRAGWGLLAGATVGLAANYLAYLVGLDLTTPANAQVLIQTAPLLLALGGILVFGERFTPAQWLGFAVLVGGLALFFAAQLRELVAGADRYLMGVGVIGIAAVTWAGYGLAQKQLLRSLSSQEVMLCIYVGCFLCFTPGAEPRALLALDGAAAAALVFCAANTLVAYGAFAAALEHWEASRVSAILSLTPLATLAFAALALRATPQWVVAERVPAAGLAGALAVVAGSLLVSLGGRDAARRRSAQAGP
jgi:drug/metabolite transporter (DMT)-like permease